MAAIGLPKALIIVENNSVPFDRRVWREAQTLRKAGWQVAVISPKGLTYSQGGTRIRGEDAEYELRDGIHIYRYALNAAEGDLVGLARECVMAYLHTVWLVLKVWRERGFDVMQVCNPPDCFFPLGWICRLAGKRFIFDHHDLVPESVIDRWRGALGRMLWRIALWSERLTMLTAHAVISTNESYRQIALQRGAIPGERVHIVRNGPLLRDLRRAEPDPRLKQGRRYLVGYLGIMGPQDGMRMLMEAIRIIVVEWHRRDIQFLLVGDGPLRPWMIERAREWGIEEYVVLPGLAESLDDWVHYLSSPDLCVSPEPPTSFSNQSTLTKIAEYMAMGQPIVAFDLKETRMTAQQAAVLVKETDPRELARAIIQLLQAPEKRAQMSAYGLDRVRQCLSWESQEKSLLQAYESCLFAKG